MHNKGEEDELVPSGHGDVELGITCHSLEKEDSQGEIPGVETDNIGQPAAFAPAAEAQDTTNSKPGDVPILEAYLVEEEKYKDQSFEEEYHDAVVDAVAIEILPWWKQKRIICASLISLLIGAMGATIGALITNGGDSEVSSPGFEVETGVEFKPSMSV